MAEENSFSQVGRAELAAIRAKFTDDYRHFHPHLFFDVFDLAQLQSKDFHLVMQRIHFRSYLPVETVVNGPKLDLKVCHIYKVNNVT